MATSTTPPNPLAESLAKVTGLDPLSTGTGTASPITYDPDQAFRAPAGDTINITGDPGSGASQSETWSHELALENLKNQQLQFQYEQQQDLLAQALSQQQFGLSSRSQAAQESQYAQNYALQKAEAQRAAAMSPYQMESAKLANQAAAYDVAAKRRVEEDFYRTQSAMAQNAAYNQWSGNAPVSRSTNAAWANYQGSPYSQGQRGSSVYAGYGVPAGTNPYTGQYQTNWVAPAKGTIIGNPYQSNSVRY